MKAAANISLSTLLCGLVVTLTSGEAYSQARTAPRAPVGGGVAVVDVGYIFKNHASFKSAMDRMKQEVQAYEEQLRAAHQALQKKREQMSAFRPGTPDYERLEREIAGEMADLQVETQLKKKEFLQRESKVYYQVYQQVRTAVAQFAEQKGIDVVLRYTRDEIDPEDRNAVLQGINSDVVFHRNLDITREILDRLNRSRVSQGQTSPTNPRQY